MNHYLNFTLLGEDGRFHVPLPWQNIYTVGFNAIEAHLQAVVPEATFERTRQLKLSEHQPESNSIDFHVWQRQQKLGDFHAYQQRLSLLIGGVVQQVGISTEGLTYLIIANSDTHQIYRVSAEQITDPTRVGYLTITEQQSNLGEVAD
ncbi:MAG: hypothetical protein NW224_12750 [Leptolyngbyaceae cyanobacterium bins.302]|nr:hypothetical protein [Leptolyngbyaceae cyanobacterium bins.302]